MTDDVLFDRSGQAGIITLNRPKALNALTTDMCVRIRERLLAWADDAEIGAVIVKGAGDKAFCAGGDVVRVADSGKAGTSDWRDFFFHEYRMNAAIAHFPKPYVSLVDGISMGGGFGISAHGSHRVVTDKTLFAMPETGLGLVPDVGGGYVLPRMPGAVGLFLALTGYRCKGADSLYAGYGTHFVPSERLADLDAALARGGDPDEALARLQADPGPAPLADQRADIDRLFQGDSVAAILAALAADGGDWAAKQHALLGRMSPMSMAVTFEQMRRGAALERDDVLKLEFRIVSHIVTAGHDFYEGVRAILIDKDKAPKWQPAALDAVTDAMVAAHFEPPAAGDLHFD